MICEMIFSKTALEIPWIFVVWCKEQFSGTLKSSNVKYLKTNLFLKKRTWSFLQECKTTNLGVIFLHKKLNLYYFQVWLFNFNIILLKTCFKNLFRKTEKKLWFYSFKQIVRTLVTLTARARACVCVCVRVCISFHRKGFSWLNKTINVMPEIRPAMLCWGNYSVSR